MISASEIFICFFQHFDLGEERVLEIFTPKLHASLQIKIIRFGLAAARVFSERLIAYVGSSHLR